jgi:hypothetical protein
MRTPLLIAALIFMLAAKAQSPDFPAELKPFVTKGYTALDFLKADLDADGRMDYILILKKAGEDTISFDNPDWDAQRPLLIITKQADGKLKKAVQNDELVMCKNCGGMMGDPYVGLETKPGQFSIDFYGGSSWRWSESYLFRYDKLKKDWYLQQHSFSSFQSGDPEHTTQEGAAKREETGDIALKNFNAYYNSDSNNYMVKSSKTYFYNSPDLKSVPRKAYVVKGNLVLSTKYFKNFIQCSFTNSNQQTTYGYILKKDLELVRFNPPKAIQ